MQEAVQCITEVRGKHVVCKSCGFKMPRRIVGDHFTANCRIRKSHRPRTAEEVKAVRATCKTCDHRTEGGGEYDAGLCKLKLGGCSSCKSIETFLAFQESGAPCPDGRFEGTELVEVNQSPGTATIDKE